MIIVMYNDYYNHNDYPLVLIAFIIICISFVYVIGRFSTLSIVQEFGCDGKSNSTFQYDLCGVCGGQSNTCQKMSGRYTEGQQNRE